MGKGGKRGDVRISLLAIVDLGFGEGLVVWLYSSGERG